MPGGKSEEGCLTFLVARELNKENRCFFKQTCLRLAKTYLSSESSRKAIEMESVVPYFDKTIDTLAGLLAPYVDDKQLDKACLWLKENDTTVIVSTFGALTLATVYFLSGGKSDQDGRRRGKSYNGRRSYKVKVKKEKVVPVDPVKQAYDIIADVKQELQNTYIPQVDKLEQDVKAEKNPGSTKTATEKKPTYKDSTEYRQLYLNESLLKQLMRLDGIEPNGVEDIRCQRKATIKEVQVQCRRLDALKELM